jgi:TPR repeat protein
MHYPFKEGAVALLILASGVSAAFAGLFEEGSYARDRGDYATAARLFRPLADHGDAKAQSNLGFMYLYGRGVSRDYVSAYMWLDLAASRGDTSARLARDLLAAKMTPVQVAEAQTMAREWKPR